MEGVQHGAYIAGLLSLGRRQSSHLRFLPWRTANRVGRGRESRGDLAAAIELYVQNRGWLNGGARESSILEEIMR